VQLCQHVSARFQMWHFWPPGELDKWPQTRRILGGKGLQKLEEATPSQIPSFGPFKKLNRWTRTVLWKLHFAHLSTFHSLCFCSSNIDFTLWSCKVLTKPVAVCPSLCRSFSCMSRDMFVGKKIHNFSNSIKLWTARKAASKIIFSFAAHLKPPMSAFQTTQNVCEFQQNQHFDINTQNCQKVFGNFDELSGQETCSDQRLQHSKTVDFWTNQGHQERSACGPWPPLLFCDPANESSTKVKFSFKILEDKQESPHEVAAQSWKSPESAQLKLWKQPEQCAATLLFIVFVCASFRQGEAQISGQNTAELMISLTAPNWTQFLLSGCCSGSIIVHQFKTWSDQMLSTIQQPATAVCSWVLCCCGSMCVGHSCGHWFIMSHFSRGSMEKLYDVLVPYYYLIDNSTKLHVQYKLALGGSTS